MGDGSFKRKTREEKSKALKAKLEEYNDGNLSYRDIAMPELEVLVYFGSSPGAEEQAVQASMKLKRVIRYHHLTRDYVDENDSETPVEKNEKNVLYKEAVERGVVVYLPEVSSGGRPTFKRGRDNDCKDPIKRHSYNAISWSDQGAFTGEMTSIHLRFLNVGKRWFNGRKINEGFESSKHKHFGYLYHENNCQDTDDSDEEDTDDEPEAQPFYI